MAKFCSQCGRPLQEGEVCNCQQQAQFTQAQQGQQFTQAQPGQQFTQAQPGQQFTQAQQGQQYTQQGQQSQSAQQFNEAMGKAANATKALIGRIIPIVKSPVEELKAIAATGESKLGVQMIVSNIIVSFLLLIIAMVSVRVKLGDAAEYVSIPYVKIIILGTISVAVCYFAMAGILHGFTKVFAKGAEASFAQSITAVGGKALYDIAVFVIGAICLILNAQFGMFVLLAGFAFTYLLMVVTYSESVALKSSCKVYALAITYVCMLLIGILAVKVFFVPILEDISGGIFSGLFSGISDGGFGGF